jgi:hypothetical protein
VFDVPTLLFGNEAKDIYQEEIRSGRFAWSEGRTEDLDEWIKTGRFPESNTPYMEVSLQKAKAAMEWLDAEAEIS